MEAKNKKKRYNHYQHAARLSKIWLLRSDCLGTVVFVWIQVRGHCKGFWRYHEQSAPCTTATHLRNTLFRVGKDEQGAANGRFKIDWIRKLWPILKDFGLTWWTRARRWTNDRNKANESAWTFPKNWSLEASEERSQMDKPHKTTMRTHHAHHRKNGNWTKWFQRLHRWKVL